MTFTCNHCGISFDGRVSAKPRRFCSHRCYTDHKLAFRSASVPDGHRQCSLCGEVKRDHLFYTQGFKRTAAQRLAGWCKDCRKSGERKRRASPEFVAQFHAKYEQDMDFRARELIRAVGKRTRKLGLAFDLDVPWLAERLKHGRCEMTGLTFDMSVATRRRTAFTPSIDRIQAGAGYTKANCRVVLYAVNAAMNDWGESVLRQIAEALVNVQVDEAVAC